MKREEKNTIEFLLQLREPSFQVEINHLQLTPKKTCAAVIVFYDSMYFFRRGDEKKYTIKKFDEFSSALKKWQRCKKLAERR